MLHDTHPHFTSQLCVFSHTPASLVRNVPIPAGFFLESLALVV